MNKPFITILIFLLTIFKASAQIKYGFHAKLGFTNGSTNQLLISRYNEAFEKKKGLTSFKGGGIMQVNVVNKVVMMPEINLVHKGLELSKTNSSSTYFQNISNQFKMLMLEIPVNIVYMPHDKPGSFFFGIGPVFSFGLSGTAEVSDGHTGSAGSGREIVKYNIKFDGKVSDKILDPADNLVHLKSTELGANFFAGHMINRTMFLRAGYYMGLSDLQGNSSFNYKTNYISVGAGFLFGKTKSKTR